MIEFIKNQIMNYFKSDSKFAKNILIFTSNERQKDFINDEIRNLLMSLFRNIRSNDIAGIENGTASFNYNGDVFILEVFSNVKNYRVGIRTTTPDSRNLDGLKVKTCLIYGTGFDAYQIGTIFYFIHKRYLTDDEFRYDFFK